MFIKSRKKKFQEVKLQNYPKVIEIYKSQFFTSLIANLEKRLFDNFSRSSHEKAKTSSKTESTLI
jgi:thiaminase